MISSPGMVVVLRRTELGNWLISWFWKSSLRSYSLPRWINTLFWSQGKWTAVDNPTIFFIIFIYFDCLKSDNPSGAKKTSQFLSQKYKPLHKSPLSPPPSLKTESLTLSYSLPQQIKGNTGAINIRIFYFRSLLKSTMFPQGPILLTILLVCLKTCPLLQF